MRRLFASILGDASLALHEHLLRSVPAGISGNAVIDEANALFRERCRGLPEGNKILFNISGLPASGKTYYARQMAAAHADFFHLAFDDIMESLSFYKDEARRNREEAFRRWEIPARVIGYDWLEECLKRGLALVFEHGNTVPRHVAMYRMSRHTYGYTVHIHYIESGPETVKPRLARRERYFPLSEIDRRWALGQRLRPAYEAVADVFEVVTGWQG